MSERARDLMLLAAGLLGLGVSAMLLVEYLGPDHAHALCGEGGGCATVRGSEYAAFFGIPTPAFGVVFFAVVSTLSILSDPRTRMWHAVVTAAGAVAGLGFLVIQIAVIGELCTYCVVVDLSAIAAFPLAWSLRAAAVPARSVRARASALVVVAAVGLSIAALADEEEDLVVVGGVPEFVSEAQKPGLVTIVEFVDFECPNCRRFHATLESVKAEYGDKVRVIHRHLPLSMHEHAIHPARGVVCAAEVGKKLEFVDAMFTASDISAAGVAATAKAMQFDMDAFTECVGSERTAAALARDRADAERAGVNVVPTFWIGEKRFRGALPRQPLKRAIELALPK